MQIWLPLLTISPEYIAENETWMAVMEDTPIACYSLKYDNHDLLLDNLWVLPDFMGQGLGSFLFNHTLQRCRLLAVMKLKIEADPHAQSFYEKMGARMITEHHSMIAGHFRVLPVMEIDL